VTLQQLNYHHVHIPFIPGTHAEKRYIVFVLLHPRGGKSYGFQSLNANACTFNSIFGDNQLLSIYKKDFVIYFLSYIFF